MKVKDYIISELERADGGFISGEQLAQKLNVTRQSVWKAIKSLQSDGYRIDCVTNRGYALGRECDKLSSAVLEERTGMYVEAYKEVTSTNTLAKELFLKRGDCAIAAESQSDGRTKDGQNFPSPKDKGVYVSCAFSLNASADCRRQVAEACESAVAGLIAKLSDGRTQRRGNRIFADGKQVCGILTEGIVNLDSDELTCIIVGTGVYTASVAEELGYVECAQRRNELIADICNALRSAISPFKKNTVTS